MDILILGAGMMGRAIAYDLATFSNFSKITIIDNNKKTLDNTKKFLENKDINFKKLDINNYDQLKKKFEQTDIIVSAIPYNFNYNLTKVAVDARTHFIDLGGNNTIVEKQKTLNQKAQASKVIVIPDCGLAPGLVSIITRDIVSYYDSVDYIKLRVGGLPKNPIPPFNYQFVFSPNGLINEYTQDAIVLDNKKIVYKKSMNELEKIVFPKPFGDMEAFITSGGCSTLPYTFRYIIKYLDYKTIRYPGHCEKFKLLLELGLGYDKPIKINGVKINPREILIKFLKKLIPTTGEDVVLLKVCAKGVKNNKKSKIEYTMIDYFDKKNNITAMMRTTGYPVSIIAQMIEQKIIDKYGVFTSEEIINPKYFFKELEKRGIIIEKRIKNI
ncbi:MAG: saccharopine dehydrogenase NADP-binding domain-containing protein [Candidatus Thermoplasmatota archaeon]|nr:saccharopine dehydrogenase NADP-binding domain-containing protein [Candidatus Thermoplasmatota archaeon]